MSECYPCHYSSTALMCMMGSVQAVGFALCVETQWTRWKLGWNIRLLSAAYTVYLFFSLFLLLFWSHPNIIIKIGYLDNAEAIFISIHFFNQKEKIY